HERDVVLRYPCHPCAPPATNRANPSLVTNGGGGIQVFCPENITVCGTCGQLRPRHSLAQTCGTSPKRYPLVYRRREKVRRGRRTEPRIHPSLTRAVPAR